MRFRLSDFEHFLLSFLLLPESATESFRKRSQNGGNGKSIARTSCCARLLVHPQARVLNQTPMGKRYQRRRRRQKKVYEVVKLAALHKFVVKCFHFAYRYRRAYVVDS